jgi:hypothetical protein
MYAAAGKGIRTKTYADYRTGYLICNNDLIYFLPVTRKTINGLSSPSSNGFVTPAVVLTQTSSTSASIKIRCSST